MTTLPVDTRAPSLVPRPKRPLQAPAELVDLVGRYGGPISLALLDPAYRRFEAPGIDGAICYRLAWGCAVASGDPVCAPDDALPLALRFCEAFRSRGRPAVFVGTGEAFAHAMAEHGASAIAFGGELHVDPRLDPARGGKGRELRKKLTHAHRAGLAVTEYAPDAVPSAALEAELEHVAASWTASRHGLQIFLTTVRLFEAPAITRWFYARAGERCVGVVTLTRLDARQGYLINHVLRTPDAPDGTSELLIAHALATLGGEGCPCAVMGPMPGRELADVRNLPPWSERFARRAYTRCSKAFHLGDRTHFFRKFQPTREVPAYLVFAPGRVGVRQLAGLLRAFNLSLA